MTKYLEKQKQSISSEVHRLSIALILTETEHTSEGGKSCTSHFLFVHGVHLIPTASQTRGEGTEGQLPRPSGRGQ